MVTATESKHEQLDLDTISEYIREPKSRVHELSALAKETAIPGIEKGIEKRSTPLPALFSADDTLQPPETDVLETLWPDFIITILLIQSKRKHLFSI